MVFDINLCLEPVLAVHSLGADTSVAALKEENLISKWCLILFQLLR